MPREDEITEEEYRKRKEQILREAEREEALKELEILR